VQESSPVYLRVDLKALLPEPVAPPAPAAKAAPAPAQPSAPVGELITIDQFGQVALKVAEVRTAERVSGTDKLLRLSVFDGERERQIVAGIAQHYAPEEMVGRRVVIVANLTPAKLKGILSEGMLLAATDAQGRLSLVTPEREVDPGAKVR
jgi:methionyl-tRNA synthetase